MIASPLLVLAALSTPIEVIYHADLEGQMAIPQCGKAATEPPDYAALVATVNRLRKEAGERGAHAPIVLNGGDSIAPDLFVRGILKRDKEAGAKDVALALKQAGYDAIAIGNHELATDRDRFERFAAAVTDLGMPLVLSNLRCDAKVQPFCQYVRSEAIVERGGQKVGILAVLSPRTLSGVKGDNVKGIQLDEPVEAITAGMARLRQAGAAAVVLMVQINANQTGFDEVWALQQKLAAGDAPEVILSSGLAEQDGATATRLVRQDNAPPLVGSSGGTVSVTRVTIAAHGTKGPRVDAMGEAARADERDAETARIMAPHIANYCDRYGKAVGPGAAAHPITKPEFLEYVLNVMRRATGSEIALLNTGFVHARPFPLTGGLTQAELKRAMPHKAVVGTARVTGTALEDLLGAGLANKKLAVLGATKDGGIKVNGRALDKSRAYTVATVEFVAKGGDGIFGATDLEAWHPIEGEPDIRDLVDRVIEKETAREDGNPSIDPATDFGKPATDRLLTVAMADLGADFTDTNISNGKSYGDAQLTRAEQRAINAQFSGILQLNHPIHNLDNRLSLKYGYARTKPAGMPAASQETLDLIQFTSIYSYKGFKDVKALPSAAVPDPYMRAFLESEFTKPDQVMGMGRTYQHLELTHTAGALFTLHPKLKLRGGAGYRKELAASASSADPAEANVGEVRFIAEAGATLDPIGVASLGDMPIKFEALFDYFMINPSGKTEHQIRSSGKVSMPLLPLLFLTAGLDIFAVDRNGAGWGASFDTTIGLRVHFDGAHQSL